MSKRVFKKFVAALALVAMLAETGYEDYSMVANVYAAEEVNEDIEVIPVETTEEIPAEDDFEATYAEDEPSYEKPIIDVESVSEETDGDVVDEVTTSDFSELETDDVEVTVTEASADVSEDRLEISGYDSITLHVVTGQMNSEDTFELDIEGPASMEYDTILDDIMTKADQGTYFIDQLEKEDFLIDVEVSEGMTFEFDELDNGDFELELISAPEPEVEKVLEVHDGSVTGAGYDSVTISLDTSALKKDTQFFDAFVLTDAEATYDGNLLEDGKISSLSNTDTSIRIDDLDKQEFTLYIEGEDIAGSANDEDSEESKKNGIVAEYTVQSVENGIVDAVISLDEVEATKREYTYEDDKVFVTAVLEVVDAIPDDADFVVKPVTASTPGYNYDAYMEALNENADRINGDEENAASEDAEPAFTEENTLLYDVAFYAYDEDGNYVELQPEEGAVRISIQFKDAQLEDGLGAEENEDVTIIHLPLVEEVKESVGSTEEATDISASDIKVEVVAENASVDGESASFTLSDFSITAVTVNGKKVNIKDGTPRKYTEILGKAAYYGVTANTVSLGGHMDTNFATGLMIGNANTTQGAYTGSHNPGDDIIASIASGASWRTESSDSSKPFIIHTTPDAAKVFLNNNDFKARIVTSSGGKGTQGQIYLDTSHTADELKKTVSDMVSGTLSSVLASESNAMNFGDIASHTSANNNNTPYLIDITDSKVPGGTFYVNFATSGDYTYAKVIDHGGPMNIRMREDQTIVFNIPDTSVSLKQFVIKVGNSETQSSTQKEDADIFAQHVVWNMPNASSAKTESSILGIVLAPKADFNVGATSTGWLVANKVTNGGEWHMVWQEMPESDPVSCSFTIKGTKTVDGKTPSKDQVFTFGLYSTDGKPVCDEDGNPITAQNGADGSIVFPELKFSGDHRGHTQGNNADTQAFEYLVKEIPGEDGLYTYSEDYYKVVIYIHTNSERANDVKAVRIEKYDAATQQWSRMQNNSWGLFDTEKYVAFNNDTIKNIPDEIELKVNKTFEGDWDDNTKVNVTIEKFNMSGIESVPDEIWNQITDKTVTLTKNNPTASFGTIKFDADSKNGFNPGYGSPEGTVKYHVYMFKITEELAVADSSVENDIGTNLGYTVAKKGVRYIKIFINTVTKDNHIFEAKISAQVKGNTNANTQTDSCQGSNGTIEFINRRNTAKVSLIKKDATSKEALSDATFYLYDSNNKPVKVAFDSVSGSYKPSNSGSFEMKTGTDGAINVSSLTVGNYYFKEVAAPNGYEELTGKTFNFTVDNKGVVSNTSSTNSNLFSFANAGSSKPATYTVFNTRKTGSVDIEKVSAIGAPLSVKFDLYKDGKKIDTLTTNASTGKASKTGLGWGSYYLVEQANPGYVDNTATKYEFTIDADNQYKSFTGDNKIVNIPIEGSFKLTKIADNKPLAGAIFSIMKGNVIVSVNETSEGNYEYSASGTVTKLKTNSNGEINVTKLPYGEYKIVEVSAPTGYVISGAFNKEFSIVNNGDAKSVTITNDKVSANIQFVKVDKTDNNKKLSGTEFTLTGVRTGSTATENFGTVKADGNGLVSFTGLGCGKYTITESKALTGYVYDASNPLAFTFEIADADNGKTIYFGEKDGKIDRVDSLKSAVVTNEEEDGKVTIKKVSDKGTALSGVKFKLYSGSKGVVANGSAGKYTYDHVATLNSTELETDSNGEITVDKLPWGTYYFKEISGVAGFVADTTTEYEFTIGQNNLADATYTGTNAIVNNTIKGYVKLIKTDAKDADVKLGDVEFDFCKDTAGSIVEKAGLKTDSQGVITYGPVEYGTYYFIEKSTVAGYTLSNGEPLKVEVTEPSTAATVTKAATVTAVNNRKLGEITLTKTDAATGAALNGARFELWTTSGEGIAATLSRLFNDNYSKYGEYVVGENGNNSGEIKVTGLPWGKYRFKEVAAPTGYETPKGDAAWSKELYIGVSEGEEKLTASVAVENNQILGKIKLVKSDSKNADKKLNGGKFALYDVNGRYNAVDYALDNGEIVVDSLPFGEYYFIELEAPEGYVTPTGDAAKSTVAKITATNTESSAKTPIVATLSNTEITGGFELHKVDGTTPLAGATFTLWADEAKKTQIKTSGSAGVYAFDANGDAAAMVTDAGGILKVSGLPYGTYYVFEETAPSGYMPNSTPVAIVVSVNNEIKTFDFNNSLIKAGVTFKKVGQGEEGTLDGAEFELFIRREEDGVVSYNSMGSVPGTNGVFKREELGAGEYKIVETKAPTGYKENTKEYTFSITAADNGKVVNLDNPDSSETSGTSLVVNERIPGKAKLLKIGSNTSGKGLKGATFAVYQKGNSAPFKSGLVSNDDGYVTVDNLPWGTYYFQETDAPFGYAKNTQKYEFTIDAQHTDVTCTDTAVNTYIEGQAQLQKFARILDKNGNEKKSKKLSGAIFDLYMVNEGAADSIVPGYEEGLISGDDGYVKTKKDLPVGSYYFLEREAPKGYEKSTTKFEFSVTEANYEKVITPTQDAGKVYNVPNLGKVKLFKYETITKDGKEEKVGLGNVTFELYQKTDILWFEDISKKLIGEYTSDGSGIVSVEDLEWGNYYFVEKEAPAGYVENKTEISFTIDENCQDINLDKQGQYICSLENTRINGSIKLVKTDSADTAKKLAGAKFELHKVVGSVDTVVKNSADQTNGYYTTDANGEIVVNNLEWANYYFVEKQAPEGYVTPTGDAAFTKTVAIDATHTSDVIDADRTIDFANDFAYGNVQITKTDANLNPLPGAKFNLYSYKDGKRDAKINVTGNDGVYAYSKEATDVVMVSPANGVVKVTGLPYGDYAFEEFEAPKGYVRKIDDITVKVTENQPADAAALEAGTAVCLNGSLSANAVLYKAWKATDGTNKALKGAEFTLYMEGATGSVSTQYSDELGVVTFTGLTEGSYYVKETATPNNAYIPYDGELKFTVTHDDDGKTININTLDTAVVNEPIKGSASLVKYYKEGTEVKGTLAGVTFDLYKGTKGTDGAIVYDETRCDYKVTGDDGKVEFTNLEWGYYVIRENKTNLPAGYIGTDEEFAFEINAETLATKREYAAYNTREMGSLEIEKIDSVLRTALTKGQTTFSLTYLPLDAAEGAVAKDLGTITVNNEGKAVKDNLLWGKYTLTETKSEEGYVNDGKVFTFIIDGTNLKQSYTADSAITNDKIKGNVELEKVDSKTKKAMPDVAFVLYKDEGETSTLFTRDYVDGQYKTDVNGKLSVKDLEYGWYHFEEVTPKGYKELTDEQKSKLKFQIKDNGKTISLTGKDNRVENTPSDGTVKLKKTDGSNPVEGAKFSLYGSDPETFGQTVSTLFNDGYYYIGTYTTDENGEIYVDGLPWQKYYFVEKDEDGKSGIPAGYSSDDPDKKYEFEITSENCDLELSYTVNATNNKLKGSALLTKVDPTKKDKDGKELTLANAKFKFFRVIDEDNATDITSTLKESVNGVLITDANGQIKIENLEWGEYYFVEADAPEGYDIVLDADGNPKKYGIEIGPKNWNATTKLMDVQTARVTNSEIYGYVKLAKRLIDSDGKVVDTSDRDLTGIEFAILGSDGKSVVIEGLKTDKEGKISAELIGKLPFGSYYFKEISVPSSIGSFPVNNELLPFEVRNTNSAEDAVEYTFDNSEVLGGAKIKKVDATSTQPIEEIVFDLYYGEGHGALSNTLKQSCTTEASGYATAKGLALGKYYFVENEQSAVEHGYKWNNNKVEFEITSADNNVIKDCGSISNERELGKLELKKLGKNNAGTLSTIPLNKDCEARFELYRVGAVDPVMTEDEVYALYNDTGVVEITDLPWGDYFFKETKAPKGYVLPVDDAAYSNIVAVNGESIAKSATMPLTASITDDTIKVYISKVEIGGSNELEGAHMQIFKADAVGNIVKGTDPVYDWTSQKGKNQLLEIGNDGFQGLVPGVTYVLHEDAAPAGYALTKDFAFIVDEQGNVTTAARKTQNTETGVWTIFVEDELINIYVDKKAFGETGNTTLTGASLAIMDGETVIDSWTTTGETHKVKTLSSNPLVIGKEYTLVENNAPAGYYTAEPITFKILYDGRIQITKDASGMATALDKYEATDADGKNQKLVGSTLTMFDRPIKLVVSKKRATGGTDDYVEGAKLSIYSFENKVKGSSALYSWTSSGKDDEIPYGILEVGKTYIIEEDAAPAGYAKRTEPVAFTVADFDPTKRTDENQLIPQSVLVTNDLLKIEVSKKALTDNGAELPGALLKVVDAAGETIAEWTSTDKPAVMTTLKEEELSETERAAYEGKNVLYGVSFEEGKTYTLVEEKAPYGYAEAASVEFTIVDGKPNTPSGQVVMVDKKDIEFFTHISGTKKWLLYRDEKGVIIPGKTYADVTIRLLQNGNPKIDLNGDGVGDEQFTTVIENGAQGTDGKQTFVFGIDEEGNDILPKKDANGADYVYTVDEIGNGEYSPTINMAGFEATITNTPIVDPFRIRGEKVWVDPEGSMHPDIEIQLYRDDKLFKTTPLKAIQASNGVKYTFEFVDLWEYNFGKGEGESLATADGHKFKYEIKEVGANGYVLSVDMNGQNVTVVPEPIDGIVNCKLTNTIAQEYITIRGTKHWDDRGDTSKRPAIKVLLYATDSTGTKTLVDKIDLPNTATSYAFGVEGRVKLPKYDDKGQVIKYNIDEEVPEGFGYISEIRGNDIYNTPSKVRVSKKDEVTGGELPGALMAIIDSNGREIERWRSTSSTHYIEGLVPGQTYTLRELEAPTGYVTASDVSFTVNDTIGDEQLVEMYDPRITGSVTLTKKDASTRDNISGAVFNLYTSSGALVNVVGSLGSYEYYDGAASTALSVGTSGTLTVTDLPYGEYYFREVTAPRGYELSSEAAYFTVATDGASAEVTYLNTKLTGRARLTKLGSDTGASLAGATFELYSKTPRTAGQAVGGTLFTDVYYLYGTYVTGSDGRLDVAGLPWDDYYFIETIAPDGHVLSMDTTGDPLVYTFTVDGASASEFAVDLGDILNDPDGGGGGGGGVAGVRRLKGGVANGVLGVRAKPTSGVLGVRVGPTTGDVANIALWLVLLVASISVVIAICVQSGKKKKVVKK